MKRTFLVFLVFFLFSGCGHIAMQPADNLNRETPVQEESPDSPAPIAGNKLDLSGQGLSKIPEYVFGQSGLEELDVSGNRLSGAIRAEIRHLGNLKVLKAARNRMTGVPAEIGQLSRLEILDLSDNQLTGLPYELGNLSNLKILDLSGNDYSEQDLAVILERLPEGVEVIK